MVFDLDTEVNVPLILNPGSICQRLIRVWCYVGTQPAPAILLGASTMTNMKAVINLSTHTVHCEALTDAKGNPYQVKLLPRLEPNGPRPLAQLSSDGDDIESFLASLSEDELDEALKLPLSDKVPIEVSTEVDCVGVAVSQAGWSLSSKNRGKLIKALNATPKTAKQLHSLIGVYNYGSTGFVTSKASEVATNLAVLHTAVHTKPFKWTPQCQHAQDFLREHLASSPRAFLAFDDLLTKCKGGPYSLAITVDAADVGIGGHLWMVRQPARATSIHDLANAEIATLISAFSLILDSHQKAWHTFEKESFAIYSAVMRWRSLLIGATRDDTAATYSLDECSIKIFTDSTVAVSRVGKGFDIDLTSSKVTLKAKRFRSWQLEVSEMSYLPICVVHSDGTSNSISDFYSRYTEFLQDSAPSTEHAVVEVGSQQQPLQLGDEISSTLFMAPNEDEDPIDSDADDTSKPGEVVHLCLTQGQAAVIETSYHTDESKYLNVPISLVWKILNDQDHHEFADNLVQRAKAWIAGGKFTRRLTESPHYGMFTQATKRQQDLRDLPWVLVIPSTAIFYEENLINHCYDPQQEATSARDSLMAYVHDGRWHLKYVAALELLFSICWWPSMAVDLKEYIEDCDYCSRTAKQASLPYRGVLSGDQRFDIVCMDHKNLPGRAGLTFTKVLTLTCPASGSTRFVPQRVADAAQTALDLYVSWVALCGWPRQVVTDGASNFCSRLSERLYALGGIRHRTALTAAPTGNAVVERRHKILGEVLNWYDSTCGIQTDDDVRMALAAAEQRINHVPDSKGTTVYARMFGIPPNWGPLQRPTRLENNQQPPNDDDLIKAINDITNHLTKDFNLRRDAKAKQNELRVCNVTDDTKYNNNRLSSASIGDKVWIQANQQAAITNIYYDSQGRARAIEAGGSLWNPRDISLVRRDLINSIPAAPMFRSDSI
ncbi:hypothetical protein FOZ61_001436 [Perkinsus olseni]|uniref:Integrase catalytic domain-containing protein n=1 Tax=Perkinsus olseni TaxID=32597 RepID=A0A7J6KPX5_PEROL|nr:hypothetical protein FOZ61_001436 [Perkinsus olseni]